MKNIPILYVAITTLGSFLFGYETAVISGALSFISAKFHMSNVMKEMTVSSLLVTTFLGALASGKCADRFGRKPMLILAALIYILGTLIIIFSELTVGFIIGRLFIGFAIGISSYTIPLYISEIAKASSRGQLLLINGIILTLGQVIALLVDYICSFSGNWRMMFFIGIIPSTLLLLGMPLVPETPRWLALKRSRKSALKVLLNLRGRKYTIRQEYKEIESCLIKNRNSLISLQKNKRILAIGILLGIYQQLFGINAIIYYGPTLFGIIGVQGISNQIFSTFLITIVNTITTIIISFVVDSLGRKPLLVVGSGIAGLNLVAVAISINLNELAWFSTLGILLYIIGYCMSIGSLFWIIIAEIFPLSIRGYGMSLATAAQWMTNLIISASFLTLLNIFGAKIIFLAFSFICFSCMVFSYYFIPETKKNSLEHIENNLAL